MQKKLLASSKKIRKFVPPIAIPGLQTPSVPGKLGGKPGAIMRKVIINT